jgi:hypothetical protein
VRAPVEGTLLSAAWPVAAAQFRAASSAEEPLNGIAAPPKGNNLLPFTRIAQTGNGLALAASADEASAVGKVPVVHRLPRDFDPLARFTSAANRRLPYTPAVALPNAASFDRPEGSFAVRAFGNVVHRFLQLVSSTVATGADPDAINIASWEPRVLAALRNEGLSTAAAKRETPRALDALRKTLQDPVGKWILSAHVWGASEYSIASAASSVLRADRTFLAGAEPLCEGKERIWIIDFKSTEQGSRSPERFQEDELLKYREQLESYAKVMLGLAPEPSQVVLGLYYPLIPRLLHWTF